MLIQSTYVSIYYSCDGVEGCGGGGKRKNGGENKMTTRHMTLGWYRPPPEQRVHEMNCVLDEHYLPSCCYKPLNLSLPVAVQAPWSPLFDAVAALRGDKGVIDKADGLPGNSMVYRASHLDNEGRLFFGTSAGLAHFKPPAAHQRSLCRRRAEDITISNLQQAYC
jgi:hypothetical protein